MTDITPNHLHIYRDRRGKHITLDGQDLLLDGEDPMLITGMENPDEVTRVMLTLLAPKITVDSEIEDREPEPATVEAPAPTLAEDLRYIAEHWEEWATDTITSAIRAAADRAEQMETEWEEELDQISADRDHWIQAYGEAAQDLSDSRAEVERLTAERGEETVAPEENVAPDQQSNPKGTLSGSLPDPADVPAGEAWQVEVDGGQTVDALRIGSDRWVTASGTGFYVWTHGVERLVRRLVSPAEVTE